MNENILRLHDVTVHYGATPALTGISVDIPCNSLTAVLGSNGAGKSTLLRAILGWHPLTRGEIRIGDSHAHHALPRLAYFPQDNQIDWDFPITVRQVVEQGRYPALGHFSRFGPRDREAVDEAMREMGLEPVADHSIRTLSGGQRQRMLLARSLAQGADVFLLDEPFTGLDITAAAELARHLKTWETQGRTVLAVLHDIELARTHFPHAILLREKLVAAGPTEAVLTDENIARAFNHATAAQPA